MSALYTVEQEQFPTSTAIDLLQVYVLQAPYTVEIVGCVIAVTSEVGEAQEEWLRLQVVYGNDTQGGGLLTPVPLDENDPSPGGRFVTRYSGPASGGTPINRWSDAMNVRQRYERWWPQGQGPKVSTPHTEGGPEDALLCFRIVGAPADSITLNYTFYLMSMRT